MLLTFFSMCFLQTIEPLLYPCATLHESLVLISRELCRGAESRAGRQLVSCAIQLAFDKIKLRHSLTNNILWKISIVYRQPDCPWRPNVMYQSRPTKSLHRWRMETFRVWVKTISPRCCSSFPLEKNKNATHSFQSGRRDEVLNNLWPWAAHALQHGVAPSSNPIVPGGSAAAVRLQCPHPHT